MKANFSVRAGPISSNVASDKGMDQNMPGTESSVILEKQSITMCGGLRTER